MIHPYRLAVRHDELTKVQDAFDRDPSEANARALATAKRHRYGLLLGVTSRPNERRFGGRG